LCLGSSDQGRWYGRNTRYLWGTREFHTDFWWGNLKENDNLKDLGLKGSIINVKEVGLHGVDCIHLDQGTDKWQGLAKPAVRLRVPYKEEKFLDQLRNLTDKKDPAP
jgi:hypothetical protein